MGGISFDRSGVTESEKSTEEFDSESMRYLSYILYPLCIGGAVYSLVYVPHKSWGSWTIQSVVNGVYAFGFVFLIYLYQRYLYPVDKSRIDASSGMMEEPSAKV